MGARRLLRRDSRGLQSSMRWRVALQTLAFGAVFGAMASESLRVRRELETQLGSDVTRIQMVEKKLEQTDAPERKTIRNFLSGSSEIVCHEPSSNGLYHGICGYPKDSHTFKHVFVPGPRP
jgi:hypothetical protein